MKIFIPSLCRRFVPVVVLLASCSSSKEVDEPVEPFKPILTVETSELPPLPASGGNATLRFSTNEPWSIDAVVSEGRSDGWFRVTPTAG